MTAVGEPGPRRGIQSVDRGLALLAAMAAAPGPAPLSALAAAAGMAAPNAHRFLASFVRAGLAVQDAATARYDLGPLALRIGLAALQRADPIAAAQRALPALVTELGVTAILVVWSERGPTIVHWQRSTPAFASALALGSLLPATGSASGRVLLAGMDARVAAREIAARHRGAEQRRAVQAEVARVRAAGFAHVSGTVIPGLAALAAPLRDAQGVVLAAVTLIGPGGPGGEPADGGLARLAPRLVAFCREVAPVAPAGPTLAPISSG
jgi:DNA-binding IclR family transcriptional regulator